MAATNPLPTLQTRFQTTSESMQNYLFERMEALDVFFTALVSGTNLFELGTPGVGKTFRNTLFKKHVIDMQDGDFFQKLMTRYTTPAEVFGALDVAAMDKGIHRHVVDYRSLIVARYIFLDELWKIGSSMANSFLSVANERVFFNDVPIDMDQLLMICGASNELPQGEGLEAIYDRFGFRLQILPLRSPSNVRKMLVSGLNRGELTIEPTISWSDIEVAVKESREVEVSDDVLDALVQLQIDLRSEGLAISERRLDSMPAVVQATAWLRGSDVAEIPDMRLLSHMCWDRPTDKPIADKLVLGLAAPFDAEAMRLQEQLDILADEVNQVIANVDNEVQRTQSAVSVHGKVQRAAAEARALRERADRPSAAIETLVTEVKALRARILRDLLLVDPSTSLTSDDD